jgi:hypothetical protein
MQIHGSMPLHVARAYGLRAAPPPAAIAPGTAAPAAAGPRGAAPPPRVDGLVAAEVTAPVEFDPGSPAPARSEGALPLYTRAADLIEAAVAV